MSATFFPYDVNRYARPLLRLVGVRPDRDGLRIDESSIVASFGLLNVQTTRANVREVRRTGPYSPLKVLGPRLSLADRGLTFGTNWHDGICLLFHEPIDAVLGPFRHPGLTLTIEDPDRAVEALRPRS